MSDETGREIIEQLKRVQSKVNACFYCLVMLLVLALGASLGLIRL